MAMVVAFAPKVEAADTAQLGLSVTFAEDFDLKRIGELKAHVLELEVISAEIFNKAIDSGDVSVIKDAIDQLAHIKDAKLEDVKAQLKEIIERRPDLQYLAMEVIALADKLQNLIADYIEKLKNAIPVISIELEGPNPWVLENVKLGEKRANISPLAVYPPLVLHHIFNTGNVTVKVAIAYGPQIDQYGIPRPGLEQGLDTFITLIEDGEVLPPNEGRGVFTIGPTEGAPLNLTYGAPKELSQPVKGMGVNYELKAYPEYRPVSQ